MLCAHPGVLRHTLVACLSSHAPESAAAATPPLGSGPVIVVSLPNCVLDPVATLLDQRAACHGLHDVNMEAGGAGSPPT